MWLDGKVTTLAATTSLVESANPSSGQDKQPLSDPSALMTAINDVVAPVLQRSASSKEEHIAARLPHLQKNTFHEWADRALVNVL